MRQPGDLITDPWRCVPASPRVCFSREGRARSKERCYTCRKNTAGKFSPKRPSNCCRALNVTLADFYAGVDGWHGPVELQLAQARVASYVVPERGVTLQHLTTHVFGKPFLPQLLVLQPGGSTLQEECRPGTVKFCYLLEGQLQVYLKNEIYTVSVGDSIFFDAALPHTITNSGKTAARALVIVSPPAL